MPQSRIMATRSGRYILQASGYRAFSPAPLPPNPALLIDDEFLDILSKADQAIGRLDASADMLPSPDLFVAMYVRKEALLSSQIEGTQASLTDVLEYELMQARRGVRRDVAEVINYVAAMNHGLNRLKELPLCNRLLREIHAQLLTDVRGEDKSPGEFRRSQNWIVGSARDIPSAVFVPPPPAEVDGAMGQLEAFLHNDTASPVLIKAGLIHSQFETIHPFLDGNGRMGRLLITFFLCQQSVLTRPILYLSAHFKQHRQEYYDRLQAVRDTGDWEQWLKFFLRAVFEVSREAADTAHEILVLRDKHRQMVREAAKGSANGLRLLDHLYQLPYITVPHAAELIGVSYPTANSLMGTLTELGLLKEITGQRRDRVFRYDAYISLLEKGTEVPAPTRV